MKEDGIVASSDNISQSILYRARETMHPPPLHLVTIAGTGNSLVACDRIGHLVLSRITGRYGEDVELFEAGTNGLDLLDIIRCQELLIIVDACLGDGPPGSVTIVEPDLEAAVRQNTSIHQISAIEALLIGHFLYPERMPRRFLLIMVNTRGLESNEEDIACERAIQALDREIGAWHSATMQPGQGELHGKQ
jgi:hydrogenase maturation protease